MSVEATFPRFLQMERTHGSLIRGMLAAMKNRPHATLSGSSASRPGAPKMTYFMSFRKGMQTLSQECADLIGPASVRLGAAVAAVEPRGKGYAVVLAGGETLEADHVMIGTSSYDASRIDPGICSRCRGPDGPDRLVLVGECVPRLPAGGREGPAQGLRVHHPQGRGPQDQRDHLQLHQVVLRKLNQAYFAFHGAYADVPGGAAGEDPVGPAVRALREQSDSLADFINTIAWMISFDQLKQTIHQ